MGLLAAYCTQVCVERAGMNPELDERIAEGVVKGNDVGGKDIADHEWGRSGP